MAEIIPAILEPSLEGITDRLALLRGAAKTVQLDVVDGVFASNRSWPYTNRDAQEEFETIASGEDGLPLWSEFDFEVDLMVSHPERVVGRWVAAGVSRVTLHVKSEGIEEALKEVQPYRSSVSAFPVMIGLALLPSASPQDLLPFKDLYDYVQVMGIGEVGFQGKPFDPKATPLVRALRAENPAIPVQVDGGITRELAQEIAKAGASRLLVGSAIVKSEDPQRALEELKKAIANIH